MQVVQVFMDTKKLHPSKKMQKENQLIRMEKQN